MICECMSEFFFLKIQINLLFQNEVSAVLGLDVRYISIVRDPVELFRSLWDYGNVRLSQTLKVLLQFKPPNVII